MSTLEDLYKLLESRHVILDGGMGTMIQRHRLDEADYRGKRFHQSSIDLKGNNDLLAITQPQLIAQIHREFLEAGADIIETNTFNANGISQRDYALTAAVYEMNLAAANLARKVVDDYGKPAWVAGSIGPTNQTASLSPDVERPGIAP